MYMCVYANAHFLIDMPQVQINFCMPTQSAIDSRTSRLA